MPFYEAVGLPKLIDGDFCECHASFSSQQRISTRLINVAIRRGIVPSRPENEDGLTLLFRGPLIGEMHRVPGPLKVVDQPLYAVVRDFLV